MSTNKSKSPTQSRSSGSNDPFDLSSPFDFRPKKTSIARNVDEVADIIKGVRRLILGITVLIIIILFLFPFSKFVIHVVEELYRWLDTLF